MDRLDSNETHWQAKTKSRASSLLHLATFKLSLKNRDADLSLEHIHYDKKDETKRVGIECREIPTQSLWSQNEKLLQFSPSAIDQSPR